MEYRQTNMHWWWKHVIPNKVKTNFMVMGGAIFLKASTLADLNLFHPLTAYSLTVSYCQSSILSISEQDFLLSEWFPSVWHVLRGFNCRNLYYSLLMLGISEFSVLYLFSSLYLLVWNNPPSHPTNPPIFIIRLLYHGWGLACIYPYLPTTWHL